MGTAKNDVTMLFHIAKKFFQKRIKTKKSGEAFAKIGSAWLTPHGKELAVFWGVRSLLRAEIATTLSEYKCAFAFGKTSPLRQLAFLNNHVPAVVVLTSSSIELPPAIANFLDDKHVFIIKATNIQQALKMLQQRSLHAEKKLRIIECNNATSEQDGIIDNIIYINIPDDIIDIIAEEDKDHRDIFINTTLESNQDNIIKKLNSYTNINAIYAWDEQSIFQNLKTYCDLKNIALATISEKSLIDKLFTSSLPTCQEKDDHTTFALIWNISEADRARISPCLSDYTVLQLNPAIPNDVICRSIIILAKKYPFTFFDYECTMPEKIHNLAKENNIPVYHLHEPLLSKLSYRKPFENPLFVVASKEKTNSLGLPDRATFMSWLDKNETPQAADVLFKRMTHLHNLLRKERKTPEQVITDIQKKNFVLAVWHTEEAEEISFETFIEAISEKMEQENIVCLALTKGKAIDKRACLSGNLRFRTVFLRHAEDFDSLCQHAKEVHVVGSFYGFEALLANCTVVTHGQPFYACFGWTKDLAPEAPIREQKFQDAAFVALFGNDFYAPYTGEKISPDQALALHHLRLRSDFSYIFEQLSGRLGKDERYPTLDLRRKYYHTADLATTQFLFENLPGSDFGILLNSLFNFSYKCIGLKSLFSSLPKKTLFDLLTALATYCRINSLFDMLCDITEQYVEWFSKNTFNENEIYTFYNLYFFLQQSNRYRDLPFPIFIESTKHDIATYKAYARIAIYSCNYDIFYLHFDSLPSMPTGYYASILSYSMEYPYGSREKNIYTRIELRQKVFSALLENIISDEKVGISQNSISLIRYSLNEDLPAIQKYALAVLDEQDKGIKVASSVASILSTLLTAYTARCYYSEAELFLRILSKAEIKKDAYLNQWKRLRKIADGFIPTGMTSAKRKQQIETIIQSNYQACLKKTSLQDIYAYSWRAAIEEFYLKSSEIIARVPQPQKPLGYILIPHFGLFQTAILPVIICALARRGYASIILGTNHLFIQNKNKNDFYKFAYSAVDKPLRLSCPWEIDLKSNKIMAFGINFYDRFVEFIRVQLRIFTIDFNNPIQRSHLQQFMLQADMHLKLCDAVYQLIKKNGVKCGLMSSFLLLLPQSIWLDFIAAKDDENFKAIFCRTALTQKMKEGIAREDVSICAMDMATHPDQRLPFLPTREKFQTWYQNFRRDPESNQILAKLRNSLLCPPPENSPAYARLLEEKASGKKVVFCYSRLLYDLSLRTTDGGPGHANMEDWLHHSIQVAAKNKDIFLVIKPHPHEEEPEFAAMPVERLQDILPALPDNVLLLHPRELKTTQILGIVDMVVIWLGTAISELIAFGVPVVVCSYAGVTDTPFDVETFKDKADYARILNTASCPPPTQDQQDMATGLIKFSKDGHMATPYRYSFFNASNDFRSIPYYDDEAVERYFAEGDPNIEHVVDQILEGFNTPTPL
ncbi:capsular polysaccharide export protein, LipB/KpsS family [Nitratidesulfovibrio vulgaris]|nr:hypothetical protein [Nitratidesulfovibrio vulgaris]